MIENARTSECRDRKLIWNLQFDAWKDDHHVRKLSIKSHPVNHKSPGHLDAATGDCVIKELMNNDLSGFPADEIVAILSCRYYLLLIETNTYFSRKFSKAS